MQHAHDNDIGVAVIDAFTHYVLQFMEKINKTSQVSMQELVRSKKKKNSLDQDWPVSFFPVRLYRCDKD